MGTDTDTLLLTPTDTTATMARDLLMLSPGMATTVADTDMGMVMAMDTATDTATATPARGLLMLSPGMATTDTDTEDTVEVTMVMVMVMATDTTVEKFQKIMLIQSD